MIPPFPNQGSLQPGERGNQTHLPSSGGGLLAWFDLGFSLGATPNWTFKVPVHAYSVSVNKWALLGPSWVEPWLLELLYVIVLLFFLNIVIDDTTKEIVYREYVDISVAVATPRVCSLGLPFSHSSLSLRLIGKWLALWRSEKQVHIPYMSLSHSVVPAATFLGQMGSQTIGLVG